MNLKTDIVDNNATYSYFFLLQKSQIQNTYKFNEYKFL